MSNSVQLHRWQPTRLPRPWDSPGKNTGVGCHFLLQCMKVESESEVAQSCRTLSDPLDCSPPGSSVHGIFQARVLEWGAIAFSEERNNHYQIKPHSPWMGESQTEKQLYHRVSFTEVKVLSPTSGSLAWGSGFRRRSSQSIFFFSESSV